MGDEGPAFRAPRPLAVLAAILASFLVAEARAAEDGCVPWPGEPTPLPRVDEGDEARARWAELRSREIVQRARLVEPAAGLESYQLWRRVLCLDPQNELARSGLVRTQPVRVHRPAVRWGEPRRVAATADPWSSLAVPIHVAPPRPRVVEEAPARRAAERRLALERVEERLRESETSLREARFEQALEGAGQVRRQLDVLGEAGDTQALRARLEVLVASAQIALGDDAEARASFARALAADPELELDARRTSPKILRVLDAARSNAGASP
jgi:hypothetical protein